MEERTLYYDTLMEKALRQYLDKVDAVVVPKEIVKKLYESNDEATRKIMLELCPEIRCPKTIQFLKQQNMEKDVWDHMDIETKVSILTNYFNNDGDWFDKNAQSYGVCWNGNGWTITIMENTIVGAFAFKTIDLAQKAVDILNESSQPTA